MGTFSYTRGPCHVCGMMLSAAGFARVAHEDMHVRNGDLVHVWKWTWKGAKLQAQTIKSEAIPEWEAAGYFTTFERCKEYHKVLSPS